MGIQRFLGDTRATAAAELALILPGIAFIVLNVVDLSVYIYTKMQVDLAAHEAVGAARVLCDLPTELPATYPADHCATLTSTMTAAAQSTTLGSSVTIPAGSTVEKYYCADTSGVLVPVALASETPPTTCTATVSGSTSAPGIYINTTASKAFSPVFPGASVAAFLPATITRTAWMRLK